MNENRHPVRQRVGAVPDLGGAAAPASGDRRVRRTQQALTHALIDLVLEKHYNAITIQNLLDRADVGRSTFYAHYRGKDDLLLRSFERMLARLDDAMDDGLEPKRVAPVRELFRHVGAFREFHRALSQARMLDRVHQAGTNHVTRTIARRIAALPACANGGVVPAAVVARASAGALFALLRWWVDQEPPYTPERMDELYHAIVLPAPFRDPSREQ